MVPQFYSSYPVPAPIVSPLDCYKPPVTNLAMLMPGSVYRSQSKSTHMPDHGTCRFKPLQGLSTTPRVKPSSEPGPVWSLSPTLPVASQLNKVEAAQRGHYGQCRSDQRMVSHMRRHTCTHMILLDQWLHFHCFPVSFEASWSARGWQHHMPTCQWKNFSTIMGLTVTWGYRYHTAPYSTGKDNDCAIILPSLLDCKAINSRGRILTNPTKLNEFNPKSLQLSQVNA